MNQSDYMKSPHPNMEYIHTGLVEQAQANGGQIPVGPGGAEKYVGQVAQGYDVKREKTAKWTIEQAIIEDMLSDLGPEDKVFDGPIGTGRFLETYKRLGVMVYGLDISPEMLQQCAIKAKGMGFDDQKIVLAHANVLNTGLWPGGVRAALMIRLSRWLSEEEFVSALVELMRISSERVIFTARVKDHPHARGYDLIDQALQEGNRFSARTKEDLIMERNWRIHRDEQGADEAYRIIELRKRDAELDTKGSSQA